MKQYYRVYAINNQGCRYQVSAEETNLEDCQKIAKSELAGSWTVYVEKLIKTLPSELRWVQEIREKYGLEYDEDEEEELILTGEICMSFKIENGKIKCH